MRAILLTTIALLPLACSASDLEISNFRSGLACTNSTQVEGRNGWICHPTELILVTDQGSCVFNKEKRLCTWYGFEFDYRSVEKGTKLHCTSTMSEPGNSGNPRGLVKKDSASDTYELELPEKEGHFYNPQYIAFNLQAAADDDFLIDTTCKNQDSIVFAYKLRLRFPLILR